MLMAISKARITKARVHLSINQRSALATQMDSVQFSEATSRKRVQSAPVTWIHTTSTCSFSMGLVYSINHITKPSCSPLYQFLDFAPTSKTASSIIFSQPHRPAAGHLEPRPFSLWSLRRSSRRCCALSLLSSRQERGSSSPPEPSS